MANFPISPSLNQEFTTDRVTYVWNGEAWDIAGSGSGGGGISTLTGLTDTPVSYSGAGGKVVKVKSDASGIEFVSGGGGVSGFDELDDVPSSYTGHASKTVKVKSDESGLEFVTVSGGGSSTLDNLTDTTISSLAGGNLLIYDGTDSWDNKAITGDVLISSAGATVIQAGSVDDAMLSGSISDGKLAQDYIKTSEVDNSTVEFTGGNLNVKSGVYSLTAHNHTGVYSPVAHTHTIDNLTDVDTSTAPPTNGQALVWDDPNSKWEPGTVSGGGGTGDVVGPTGATDNNIATFDSNTGKLIQDGGVALSGLATSGHTHTTYVAGPGSAVDNGIATFDTTSGKLIQDSGTLISGLATSGHTHSIDNLTDVDTGTAPPTNGQALVWDDPNSKWEPGTVTGTSPWTDSGTVLSPTNGETVDVVVIDFDSAVMRGHILPDTDNTYDIGSAEYKIRDMYVSDNSLWVGDDHKVDTKDGKVKFRKRKGKTEVPPTILAENGTSSGAIAHAGVTYLYEITLAQWLSYYKSLTGNADATINDVFRPGNDEDYSENLTAIEVIDDIANVDTSAAAAGKVLEYDGANWIASDTGNVVGPPSPTDGNIVLFDGTSGELIKDSAKSISDFAASGHNHTGVYSPVAHDHSIDNLTDVDTTTTAPTNGQGLIWDDTNSTWEPGGISWSGGIVSSAVDIRISSTGNQKILTLGEPGGAGNWGHIFRSNNTTGVLSLTGNSNGTEQSVSDCLMGWNRAGDGSVGVGITPYQLTDKLTIAGVIALKEVSAPSSSTDFAKIYSKDISGTSKMFVMDSAGVEIEIGTGSGNLTTKGDLEVYTTQQTNLTVGTDGYVLTADSAEASGLKWAATAAASEWVASGTTVQLATLTDTVGLGVVPNEKLTIDGKISIKISTFPTAEVDYFKLYSIAGLPENIKLMIQGNGVDGSQLFEDLSDSGHNITYVGNPEIETDSTINSGRSNFGSSCIKFVGSGHALDLASSNDWDFGTGDFTIDFWARRETNATNNWDMVLATNDHGGVDGGGYFLEYSGNRGLWFYNGILNHSIVSYSGISPNDGTWHHIGISRSSGTVKAYIDGTQVDSQSHPHDIKFTGSRSLRIGGGHNNNSYFDGYIDDLRIIKGDAIDFSITGVPTAQLVVPVSALYVMNPTGETTQLTGVASGWTDSESGVVKLSESADVIELGDKVDASSLPTSAPGTSGRLWNDSGTLKIS